MSDEKIRTEGLGLLQGQLGAALQAEDLSRDENRLADLVLAWGQLHRASDVHLDPVADGCLIRMRIDGALHDVAQLDPQPGAQLLNQFKILAGLDPTTVFHPEDARWTHHIGEGMLDVRLSIVPCLAGPKAALRLLDRQNVGLNLDQLGMHPQQQSALEEWLATVSGMLICAGPIGSGKTTTLYALLRELIPNRRHIASIEDPPEYALEGVNQLPVDPENGIDYAGGLRAILRMDPDYVMLGEVRSAETAAVLIDAANAGRMALTSMHARDAVAAIGQMRHLGIDDHVLAANTSIVIAQRLVRALCPRCRREDRPNAVEERWFAAHGLRIGPVCWRPVGCEECRNIGYNGRLGVFEVWLLDNGDAEAIRRGCPGQNLRARLRATGFISLLEDGLSKLLDGRTSIDELRRAAIPLHAHEESSGTPT